MLCVCLTGAVALGQAYFGEGSGRIYLDNVNCRREEVTINDCEHSGVSNHNCGHSEDAGVICLGRCLGLCLRGELLSQLPSILWRLFCPSCSFLFVFLQNCASS